MTKYCGAQRGCVPGSSQAVLCRPGAEVSPPRRSGRGDSRYGDRRRASRCPTRRKTRRFRLRSTVVPLEMRVQRPDKNPTVRTSLTRAFPNSDNRQIAQARPSRSMVGKNFQPFAKRPHVRERGQIPRRLVRQCITHCLTESFGITPALSPVSQIGNMIVGLEDRRQRKKKVRLGIHEFARLRDNRASVSSAGRR